MAGILIYEPAFDRKLLRILDMFLPSKRLINSSQSLKRDRRSSFPASKWTKILGTLVCIEDSSITALFTNMRILKFKSQLTIAFFAAVNYLNGPLRKQNFPLTGSKGQGLWFVIGGFRSVWCVSVFQGSLLVIVIMIGGSENRHCECTFKSQSL